MNELIATEITTSVIRYLKTHRSVRTVLLSDITGKYIFRHEQALLIASKLNSGKLNASVISVYKSGHYDILISKERKP